MLIVFFLLFFFLKKSIQQYQNTYHLRGVCLQDGYVVLPKYGVKGKYNESNTIGSTRGSLSFVQNSEVLVFYGESIRFGYSDNIWSYSKEKNQWKFVKGRSSENEKSIFNKTDVFDKDIEIGGKSHAAGWYNQDNTMTFFGGKFQEFPCSNEMWMYNITSNEYSIIHPQSQLNDYQTEGSFFRPLFSNVTIEKEYHKFNFPSARSEHLAIKINDHETFVMGGYGFLNSNHWIDYLGDFWFFSNTLMQWKIMGGNITTTQKSIVLGETNIYHHQNTIGSRASAKGLLINEEELLVFGGHLARFTQVNIIQKYNITSNMWKYVSGSRDFSSSHFPIGYNRQYTQDNLIGGRSHHGLWRINDNELLVFGGYGSSSKEFSQKTGTLNDLWMYNLQNDQWKFIGKEETKACNQYAKLPNYPEANFHEETLMGGILDFVGEFFQEENELLILTGKGFAVNIRDQLMDDSWSIYLGNTCYAIEDRDPEVCSNRGSCDGYNYCNCDDGYFGDQCELTKCYGILSNSSDVCSKNGICSNGECTCFSNSEYTNEDCSTQILLELLFKYLWVVITVPSVGLGILVSFIFIILCLSCSFSISFCNQKLKLRKYEEIEDIELIIAEQKTKKKEISNTANFNINKKLFEIDPKDVKIEKKIGSGGSSAVVYSAIWNQQKVAYKCFVIQDFLEDNKYKEFEKEVEFLASINFPHILNFFGATLSRHRLGFVMEFAENGDLMEFLKKYKKENQSSYPFTEKIRMLYEISSAMTFLHHKTIVHRDLKLKNILVTSKEETKLMDFGLSTMINESNSNSTKTKKIGTSFFMAPEVVSGHYSFSCDVYSFAMLMFVVLTENFFPFGQYNEHAIIFQIKKNPNLRPDIDEMDELKFPLESNRKNLKKLITKNWNFKPERRMRFQEITNALRRIMKGNDKIEKLDPIEIENERLTFLEKENEEQKKLIKNQRKTLFSNEKEILFLKEELLKLQPK